ncbi:hypothetical protein [Streptosporangium roseum]
MESSARTRGAGMKRGVRSFAATVDGLFEAEGAEVVVTPLQAPLSVIQI